MRRTFSGKSCYHTCMYLSGGGRKYLLCWFNKSLPISHVRKMNRTGNIRLVVFVRHSYFVEFKRHQIPRLPWSGKNIWKMKFFPGQGKVREFCGWSGKFRKDLESQGKVREFENKWL